MTADAVQKCLELLAAGATVVTANKRLARSLREACAREQEAAGRAVWPTPDALPWQAWLARLWDAAAWAEPLPALIGDALEQELWRAAIASDTNHALLDVTAAASAAREAHRRLAAWRVPADELQRYPTDESRALLRWLGRVEQRCAREQWIDPARLPDELARHLPGLGSALPRRVALIGFDEITPQQQAFFQALELRGTHIDVVAPVGCNDSVRRVQLADARAELETAARWALARLRRDPGVRVGVVVPDLAERRDDVQRIFTSVLAPEAAGQSAAQARLPFSISAGRSLVEYPLVDAALQVLALARRPLPGSELGELLRSPHIGGAGEEATRRALLDARLRELGYLDANIGRIVREAGLVDVPYACPQLCHRLQAVEALSPGLAGKRLPGDWLDPFDRVLEAAGWPGDRPLSSHEFQTIDAFRSLERELYTLGAVAGPLSFNRALALLERLAAGAEFQPESPAAAVEILGALQAAGQSFEHLWIAGLHDEVWPAVARPNGFLPVALQREHGMPHASAERELEFATIVTARLVASAREVIASSPRVEEDRPLRPSPLIRGFEPVEETDLDLDRRLLPAERLYAARALERLPDDPAPALGVTERARGGAQLLRHQAACPFRAFAQHRLHADALESPSPGIDLRERGELLHAALAQLWSELRDQRALLRLGAGERASLIARAVAAAARPLFARHPPRHAALEVERAERLLELLLALETTRAPFVVEDIEMQQPVRLGGIDINARIDRIDRLDDGGRVIIDYKTGRTSVKDLSGERPKEPQLPLYAVAAGSDIAAVGYAVLHSDDVGLVGLAREAGIADDLVTVDRWRDRPADTADWDSLLARWRDTLERLARDFAAGCAEVDPRDQAQTCRLCHLAALCRIEELRAGTETDHVRAA